MANTTSAQKAMRQAQRRTARNQAARSAVRTYFKKASVAVAGTKDDAAEAVLQAVRALDRAAQRGIIHRNAAARRKSSLMTRLHQLSLAAADEQKATTAEAKAGARKPAARSGDKKATARKPAARKAPAKK